MGSLFKIVGVVAAHLVVPYGIFGIAVLVMLDPGAQRMAAGLVVAAVLLASVVTAIVFWKGVARLVAYHGRPGVVVAVGRGPGPRDVGVKLDGGGVVVVPRGNLNPEG